MLLFMCLSVPACQLLQQVFVLKLNKGPGCMRSALQLLTGPRLDRHESYSLLLPGSVMISDVLLESCQGSSTFGIADIVG